jgi:hypothetical protein
MLGFSLLAIGGFMIHENVVPATEEWRPVVGWEGWYSVSNTGRIMRVAKGRGSYPGRLLKPQLNHDGYPVIGMTRGDNKKVMRLVHTLVVEAFIGTIPDGMEVNHKDGIKTNNYPGNFEFLTHLENMRHASRMKLWKKVHRGESASNVKLTSIDVNDLRRLARMIPRKHIVLLFEISNAQAYRIISRKAWKHLA